MARVKAMRGRIFYLDAVRCIAISAVVLQHICANYMFKIGEISTFSWEAANLCVSLTRWAVPAFIMLTGALLIRPDSDFNALYFTRQRLFKVFIPFIAWSLLYALWISNKKNFYPISINFDLLQQLIFQIPIKKVYSHLGFFYYFIPLYFVIPLLSQCIRACSNRREIVHYYSIIVLIMTAFYLLGIRSWWLNNVVIFSGYLIIGYTIHNYDFIPSRRFNIITLFCCIICAFVGTHYLSSINQTYSSLFFNYKTVHIALSAACFIQLCKHYMNNYNKLTNTIAKHSLGIFFVHYFFIHLINEHIISFDAVNPFVFAPFAFILVMSGSIMTCTIIQKSRMTKWLSP